RLLPQRPILIDRNVKLASGRGGQRRGIHYIRRQREDADVKILRTFDRFEHGRFVERFGLVFRRRQGRERGENQEQIVADRLFHGSQQIQVVAIDVDPSDRTINSNPSTSSRHATRLVCPESPPPENPPPA